MPVNSQTSWRSYYRLTKPKVVALIVFTAWVGMLIASPTYPPLNLVWWASLGIGLASAGAAVLNHIFDQKADEQMKRTHNRPIPQGLPQKNAWVFAFVLIALAMVVLGVMVNMLTLVLTLCGVVGYAIIYTLLLKRATPQNIVIGGVAGAIPPVLGSSAILGEVSAESLLLFLIIFVWTPPHFWVLAIYRKDEYAKVNIPMLPVTHGVTFTKQQIIIYTFLLVVASSLPFVLKTSGWLYFLAISVLNVVYVVQVIRLYRQTEPRYLKRNFSFSIWYLMLLFAFLLIDHYAYLLIPSYG